MIVYSNPKLIRSEVVHFTSFFIMPNSTQFSAYEQEQIIAYRNYGVSRHEIARNTNRSKRIIYYFWKNPKGYGKKKRTGRLPTLTMCPKRAIFRRACLEKAEFHQTKIELNEFILHW